MRVRVCVCDGVQVCGQIQAAFDAVASVARDQKAFAQGAAAHKRHKTILLQMRKVDLTKVVVVVSGPWLTPSPHPRPDTGGLRERARVPVRPAAPGTGVHPGPLLYAAVGARPKSQISFCFFCILFLFFVFFVFFSFC